MLVKAITVRQPWASLIADGRKRIETRGWPLPAEMLGERLAIHAAKQGEPTLPAAAARAVRELYGSDWRSDLPSGAIIATVRVLAVRRVEKLLSVDPECVLASGQVVRSDGFGDYSLDRWLWILDAPQKLATPVKTKGKQGLWCWETDSDADASADAGTGTDADADTNAMEG